MHSNPPILPHASEILGRTLTAYHNAETPYESANARDRFHRTRAIVDAIELNLADTTFIPDDNALPFAIFILN